MGSIPYARTHTAKPPTTPAPDPEHEAAVAEVARQIE